MRIKNKQTRNSRGFANMKGVWMIIPAFTMPFVVMLCNDEHIWRRSPKIVMELKMPVAY